MSNIKNKVDNKCLINEERLLHIDGLRGLSVIFVFLFHFDEKLFMGGFLGVDTFFVISGYVISRSLLKNRTENFFFDIRKFFLKRFFRIGPALFIFLMFSLLIYFFYGLTLNHHRTLFTAISSILGISNLYLGYIGVDYFLIDKINYYLHTWSLGVEEQFYIFYPFILLLFARKSNYIICLLFFISFIFFLFYWDQKLGGFYSPLTRFWEIFIGCFLYIFIKDKLIQTRFSIRLLIIIGYLLNIFFLSGFISLQLQILINIFFSACLIIFFSKSRLLCNRLLVHIGLISFSMYLWHYFIIHLAGPFIGNTLNKIIIIISFSYIISYLSFNLVERYFIYKNVALRKHYILFCSFLIFFSSFVLFNLNVSNIQYSNFNVFKSSLVNSIWVRQDQVLQNNFFNKKLGELEINITRTINPTDLCIDVTEYKCLKRSVKNNNAIFLVGDSHANHLIDGLIKSNDVENLFLGNECMHILIVRHLLYGELRDKAYERIKNCEKYSQKSNFLGVNNLLNKYNKIFYMISIRVPLYAEKWEIIDKNYAPIKNNKDKYLQIYNNLVDHIEELNSDIEIILIEPIPTFKYGPEYCMISEENCFISRSDIKNKNEKTRNIFKNISAKRGKTKIVNFNENFCNENICSMKEKNGNILYFDSNHLSKYGSETLVKFYKKLFD